jgi:hypothetical protein
MNSDAIPRAMPAIPPLLIEVVPFVSEETGAAPGVLVVALVWEATNVLLVLEFGVDVETPVPELLVVDDFVVEAEEEAEVEVVDDDIVDVVDDDIIDVVEVVETPIVAAIATRLFIAQHASDVMSPPQHQLPSVKHWDTAAVPCANPPVCANCQFLFDHLTPPTSFWIVNLQSDWCKRSLNKTDSTTMHPYTTPANIVHQWTSHKVPKWHTDSSIIHLEGTHLRIVCDLSRSTSTLCRLLRRKARTRRWSLRCRLGSNIM